MNNVLLASVWLIDRLILELGSSVKERLTVDQVAFTLVILQKTPHL